MIIIAATVPAAMPPAAPRFIAGNPLPVSRPDLWGVHDDAHNDYLHDLNLVDALHPQLYWTTTSQEGAQARADTLNRQPAGQQPCVNCWPNHHITSQCRARDDAPGDPAYPEEQRT